jgi:hypothetical protein
MSFAGQCLADEELVQSVWAASEDAGVFGGLDGTAELVFAVDDQPDDGRAAAHEVGLGV